MKKKKSDVTGVVNIGAVLAGMRKLVASSCETCGKPIEGLKTKKFCNDYCKRKAYLKRKNNSVDSSDK